MRKLMITALMLASLATITGCVKDGLNGRDGRDGVDGKDGLGGNVNIENSTFTIQANQWYTRGVFQQQGFQYYCLIDVPRITQDVMENGAVMIYVQQSDLFYPLPAITNNNGYVNTIQNNVYSGTVEIFVEDTDFQTENPGIMTFKIVIFDQLSSLPKDLDIKDYKQVVAYLND
jgi:hypothetical protein